MKTKVFTKFLAIIPIIIVGIFATQVHAATYLDDRSLFVSALTPTGAINGIQQTFYNLGIMQNTLNSGSVVYMDLAAITSGAPDCDGSVISGGGSSWNALYSTVANSSTPSNFINYFSSGATVTATSTDGTCLLTFTTTATVPAGDSLILQAQNNGTNPTGVVNSGGMISCTGSGARCFAYPTYVYLGDTVPNPPVSLNYLFPTNGITTAPFPAYNLSVDNVTSSDRYLLITNSVAPQLTSPQQTVQIGYGSDFTNGLVAPNTLENTNFGNATSVAIVSQSYLYDITTYPDTIVYGAIPSQAQLFNYQIGAANIGFLMIPLLNGPINPNGTTTINVVQPERTASGTFTGNTTSSFQLGGTQTYNLSETSTTLCQKPSNISDIGGGISYGFCQVISFLFIPPNSAVDSLTGEFTKIQGDFPFNMVFGTIGLFENGAATAASSTDGSLSLPVFGASAEILSSSTLTNFVGSSNKSLIFQVEDGIAWVGVAFTILKLIY